MNFKRIKTIFIVLFALTNLFLGITIICNSYENTTIKNELIVEVRQILKNNGIEIEESAIPSKKIVLPKLVAVDNAEVERKIVSELLGYRYELKSIDGTETYVYKNNKLVLKNGNLIVFEDQNSNLEGIDEKSALEYVKNFIKSLNQKNSEHYIIISNEKDGNFYFKIGQKFDKILIDTSELNVYISKDGKMSVNGTYIYTKLMPLETGTNSDPLNAILKFIKYNTQSAKIVAIEPCYLIKNVLNTTLTPAYKITNEKGNNYYLDVVSGQKIK